MQSVSKQIRDRVDARIEQCRVIINDAYMINNAPTPMILYNINSSRTAGLANGAELIRLNPAFLNHNTDHYIKQVVAHEYAHCAATAIHGPGCGHGVQWKRIMQVLGLPPDRLHKMELPPGIKVGKPKKKIGYHCNHCKEPVPVSNVVHNKIQRGATYWHKPCGKGKGNLVFSRVLGNVSNCEAKRLMKQE